MISPSFEGGVQVDQAEERPEHGDNVATTVNAG